MMEIVTLVLAGLACALSLANLLRRPRGLSGEDLEKVRQDLLAEIRQTRQELSGSVAAGLQASNVQTEQKLESIRTTMEVRLNAMQAVTDRRLGEMRQTVDEKLQKTLEDRLQKSFGLVSQQLELVYKGLGEMRTLAAGVGDLKKVLSNVKTRGILGEVQLGAILEQLLAPGQYAENVATVPGSSERVEFAVKLPGDGDGPVWLPIDAKFPQDAYAALLAAYDTADKAAVELAAKELDKRVRGFGKDIHDKYIAPGHTTDFGVMFLPVEGLYAEVVRRGTAERLQREYKIVVAGPTTMAALLNSLQMGFKTLAIQKRSSEVWKVLGSVKAEFDTFGQALAQTQNRLNQASSELENLVGVRTRQIQRKLQQVTLLPGEGDGAENLPPEQKDGY
ncbi:MAG TPA: DNA recombination protein RmuC [Candidatus Fournierella merdipullorum]|uniref:DNA recombination protein RmuC n=1 Tax=Candidatus Allofournierella merdipullorum TaxID=2838595 RepID=A0A9D2E6I3_9FIRM|nr:DNA recombination protein RmuC [Candidatus Fournierella merdipullorum]